MALTQKEYDEFEKKCALSRGLIIDKMVVIESFMEFIIAWSFCKPEMVDEFIGVIAAHKDSKLSLNAKFATYGYIITNYHPEFCSQHPEHLKILGDLIVKRNIAAHRRILYTKEHKMEYTWTSTSKHKPNVETWGDNEYEEYLNRLDTIKGEIQTLFNKLNPKGKL